MCTSDCGMTSPHKSRVLQDSPDVKHETSPVPRKSKARPPATKSFRCQCILLKWHPRGLDSALAVQSAKSWFRSEIALQPTKKAGTGEHGSSVSAVGEICSLEAKKLPFPWSTGAESAMQLGSSPLGYPSMSREVKGSFPAGCSGSLWLFLAFLDRLLEAGPGQVRQAGLGTPLSKISFRLSRHA